LAGRHLAAQRLYRHCRLDGRFVVNNVMLIVAGALVGASGAILTRLMANAMNRSIPNILMGGFGGREGNSSRPGDGGRDGTRGLRRRRRHPARLCQQSRDRARVWPGCRASSAWRSRTCGPPRSSRHRSLVRDPSCGRPHAGPHECPAGRGQRAIPTTQGDGRHKPPSSSGRTSPS